MWPSTSSSRAPRARGFTLLEAMISLLLLVIVLIVAMTMLFQMRAFAERQQYFMLPRQAARRATDYLSYYIAGASDLNFPALTGNPNNPNALITYYNLGGVLTQASYNNLTTAQVAFGDVGTDIITMVAPFNPSRYQVQAFPPVSVTADLWLNFRDRVGCATDNNAANLDAFKAATGFDGTQSALLMLVAKTGSWAYVRIAALGSYKSSDCANTAGKNINIQVDTTAAALAPPNGAGVLTDPVYLVAGLQVISFRVLTDSVDGIPKLQQKLGLFDPATDNPGTAFTNVMENVEDLQVAYMYPNGAIWNTATAGQTLAAPGGVPPQAGPSGVVVASPLDIQNVIGLRFSVTGRSPLLPIGARKLTTQHFRPASEDHAGATVSDQFDHYRATATLMLRNRIPRG